MKSTFNDIYNKLIFEWNLNAPTDKDGKALPAGAEIRWDKEELKEFLSEVIEETDSYNDFATEFKRFVDDYPSDSAYQLIINLQLWDTNVAPVIQKLLEKDLEQSDKETLESKVFDVKNKYHLKTEAIQNISRNKIATIEYKKDETLADNNQNMFNPDAKDNKEKFEKFIKKMVNIFDAIKQLQQGYGEDLKDLNPNVKEEFKKLIISLIQDTFNSKENPVIISGKIAQTIFYFAHDSNAMWGNDKNEFKQYLKACNLKVSPHKDDETDFANNMRNYWDNLVN